MYQAISKSSFQLRPFKITNFKLEPNLDVVTECRDMKCLFNREKSRVRHDYQQQIVKYVGEFEKCRILFYGCHLLLQEITLISSIIETYGTQSISEVHFTDVDYANQENHCRYHRAFVEFMRYVTAKGWMFDVYLHLRPDSLLDNIFYQKRFHLICGIDLYSEVYQQDHDVLIQKLTTETLCHNGYTVAAYSYHDGIDINIYELRRKACQTTSRHIYHRETMTWQEKLDHFLKSHRLKLIYDVTIIIMSINLAIKKPVLVPLMTGINFYLIRKIYRRFDKVVEYYHLL